MAGIYDEKKMKQKPIYPTVETPQYSDWALFKMGKELEKKVDELEPGTGGVIESEFPIVADKEDDITTIKLRIGNGLTTDVSGYLTANLKYPLTMITEGGETYIAIPYSEGLTLDNNHRLCVRLGDGLKLDNDGNITLDVRMPEFLFSDGQLVNCFYLLVNSSEDATITDEVDPTTGELTGKKIIQVYKNTVIDSSVNQNKVATTGAIKNALDTKQNKMTAPVTGGLIITGTSENLIGINFKSGGGVTYDNDGAVMVDDAVVQHKLTAGNGIAISNNQISGKFVNDGGIMYDSDGAMMVDDTVQRKLTAGAGLEISNNVVKSKYSGGVPRMGTKALGTRTYAADSMTNVTATLNLPDNRMKVPSNGPWWVVAGCPKEISVTQCLFVTSGSSVTMQATVVNRASFAIDNVTITIGYMGWIE